MHSKSTSSGETCVGEHLLELPSGHQTYTARYEPITDQNGILSQGGSRRTP